MADKTAIEWTDATWNPLRGCARVSKGCQHCYAERVAARFSGPGQPYEGLIHPTTKGWNGTIKLVPEVLDQPGRWRKPRRIFVNSMSDLFHEAVPDAFIDRVFTEMRFATQHTFQVLTKRPARMLAYLSRFKPSPPKDGYITRDGRYAGARGDGEFLSVPDNWPLRNVWLGVSVEDQATADERIPLLLQCPAAVRWISAEPLLGPVDLEPWLAWPDDGCELPNGKYFGCAGCDAEGPGCVCPNHRATFNVVEGPRDSTGCPEYVHADRVTLDWVVAGGESGPGARPMDPDWARSLRDQCAAAGVPFLFKQWGEWVPMGGYAVPFMPHKRIPAAFSFQKMVDCNGDTFAMERVGKKIAGRHLDGQIHDGYPP